MLATVTGAPTATTTNAAAAPTVIPAKILSDEPRLSSAALCLTLNHCSNSFRPEYTHQCLEKETFDGHQPLQSILDEEVEKNTNEDDSLVLAKSTTATNQKILLHESHLHHDQVKFELDVQIQLAPSCRQCQVQVNIQPKDLDDDDDTDTNNDKTKKRENDVAATDESEPQNTKHYKKQKLQDDTSGTKEKTAATATAVSTNESPKSVSFLGLADSSYSQQQQQQQQPAVLSTHEIQQSIQKALPNLFLKKNSGDNDDTCVSSDYLSAPVGEVLEEYSIRNGTGHDDDDPKQFVLCLADGSSSKEVMEYHDQIQKLALWFIENADDVDVANTESGYWKILYLFQRTIDGDDDQQKHKYALVGYMTLFHFHAPFHKPVPGIILRICQALVLPPYQGQRHGRRMMQCVYDYVHGKYDDDDDGNNLTKDGWEAKIVQVNVEDPAPGFVALRNKVDMKLLEDHRSKWFGSSSNVNITDETFFASIPDTEAQRISTLAKITPHQVHVAHELIKLKALHGYLTSSPNKAQVEELERRYRLLVKRRLNKDHREDMSIHKTKDAKKAFLAKLFDEEYEKHCKLLRI